MSQESLEVARQHIEAYNRGDVDALVALVSPDVEWEDSVFWTESARVYRGWAELRGWFTKVVEPEVRGWFVLWIVNGKITRRQVFLSRDDALEAAGLSE